MGKAARAIIIEDGKILVMHRNKEGGQYFTLVGGRVDDAETIEQGLAREVKEETGMTVASARYVYYEEHGHPYNDQYVFLCEVAPHGPIALLDTSEEAFMNRLDANVHTPRWVEVKSFDKLPFRTPQLQQAIMHALKKGFPKKPVRL